MKDKLIVRTRWEYYVANVAGILALIGLFTWFFSLAFTNDGIDFTSVYFWLALLLLIIIPYALIGFFSSMKSVEVTVKGLTIAYVFQKHQNVVRFADVVEMKSRKSKDENTAHPRAGRDTFTLVLADKRVFEFSRSQFDQYGKLKSICRKQVKS